MWDRYTDKMLLTYLQEYKYDFKKVAEIMR